MFKYYLASDEDLSTIDEALRYVWNSKMDFVFSDRSKISKTNIISYDSKYIYLWEPKSGQRGKYNLVKIPHKLKIDENWHRGWKAGIWIKEIEKLLPFTTPCISGGLLTPFITLQKKKKISKYWPYTTRKSYLATIIHEFGHIYWNQFKLWWPSDKKYNINLLKLARQLYQKKTRGKVSFPIKLSVSPSLREVFAFCSEYYASGIFWPNHKLSLDKFSIELITKLIKTEKGKDLDKEDSVIEPSENQHNFATVMGKIILTKLPTFWPSALTSPQIFWG